MTGTPVTAEDVVFSFEAFNEEIRGLLPIMDMS